MPLKPADQEFTPDTIALIQRAYRHALEILDLQPRAALIGRPRLSRVELINVVVDLVRDGERDERRLQAKALFHALQREAERDAGFGVVDRF